MGNLSRLANGRPLKFCTFTARPADERLSKCIEAVCEAFGRLRRHKEWVKAVEGGAFTLEVTRGRSGDHWHVHVHCLFAGKFIDQRRLSELWRLASRGSYIVDIRATRNDSRHVEYVASYAAKGWCRDTLTRPDWVDESMIALKGRRLIAAFGSWYGVELLDEPPDEREFVTVGTLVGVMRRAVAGDVFSQRIVIALGGRIGPIGASVEWPEGRRG